MTKRLLCFILCFIIFFLSVVLSYYSVEAAEFGTPLMLNYDNPIQSGYNDENTPINFSVQEKNITGNEKHFLTWENVEGYENYKVEVYCQIHVKFIDSDGNALDQIDLENLQWQEYKFPLVQSCICDASDKGAVINFSDVWQAFTDDNLQQVDNTSRQAFHAFAVIAETLPVVGASIKELDDDVAKMRFMLNNEQCANYIKYSRVKYYVRYTSSGNTSSFAGKIPYYFCAGAPDSYDPETGKYHFYINYQAVDFYDNHWSASVSFDTVYPCMLGVELYKGGQDYSYRIRMNIITTAGASSGEAVPRGVLDMQRYYATDLVTTQSYIQQIDVWTGQLTGTIDLLHNNYATNLPVMCAPGRGTSVDQAFDYWTYKTALGSVMSSTKSCDLQGEDMVGKMVENDTFVPGSGGSGSSGTDDPSPSAPPSGSSIYTTGTSIHYKVTSGGIVISEESDLDGVEGWLEKIYKRLGRLFAWLVGTDVVDMVGDWLSDKKDGLLDALDDVSDAAMKKFPFCVVALPSLVLNMLVADPVVPEFTYTLDWDGINLGGYKVDGFSHDVHIDLKDFDGWVKILRKVMVALYCLSLIGRTVDTVKLIKDGGISD